MTTRELPAVLYKIHAYFNNFIVQLFQKAKKTGVHFRTTPLTFPHYPPSTKKILTIRCVQEKILYNWMKKLSL